MSLSEDAPRKSSVEEAKKKGEKPGKIQLQNITASIDCWAVIDTPLDFSFMKLTKPTGEQNVIIHSTTFIRHMHIQKRIFALFCSSFSVVAFVYRVTHKK